MSSEFATLLRRKRMAADLPQSALAKATGISPSHLNRIEKGERNPPPADKVIQIASALRLSPAETDQLLVAAGYAPQSGPLPPSGLWPNMSPEVRDLVNEVTAAILRVAEAPGLTPAQREDVVRLLRTLDLPAMIGRLAATVPEALFAAWQRETVAAAQARRPELPDGVRDLLQSGSA